MECELGIQFETIDVVDKLKAGSGSLDSTKSLRGIKIGTGSLKLSSSKSPGSHFSHAGLNCSPLIYLGMKLKIGLAFQHCHSGQNMSSISYIFGLSDIRKPLRFPVFLVFLFGM